MSGTDDSRRCRQRRTGNVRWGSIWTIVVIVIALVSSSCAGTQPRDLVASDRQGSVSPVDPEEDQSGAVGSVDADALESGERQTDGLSEDPTSPSEAGQQPSGAGQGDGDIGGNSRPPETGDGISEGNGGATDVGVTADEILLGGFFVESGPVGELGITLLKAAKAAFNEVNAEGGIHGRKIKLIDCDTSYTSGEKPRRCYSKLVERDKVFALAASGDGPAWVTAAPLACKDRMLGLWLDGLAGAEFECPTLFPTGPSARSQSHVLADYYYQRFKPATVGFLVENDEIGREALAGAKRVLVDKYGVDVVAEEYYNVGESNMSSQVTAMRFANPDFIFFANEPLGGILFQLTAKSQGYKPSMPMAGIMCNMNIWPKEVGEYAEGMICQHPWQLETTGLPEQVRYEKTYKKYWSDWQNRNYYTEVMWVAANAVVETLREAGPNLTRDRVLEVLKSGALSGYDTGFGVTFQQNRTPQGGNVFSTSVAVIEITNAAGPEYYSMRRDPAPDPYFEGA